MTNRSQWPVFAFTSLFLLQLALTSSAEARDRTSKKRAYHQEEESLEYSQASLDSTYTVPGEGRLSIGFSTVQSTIPGSTAALTGILDLSRYDALQGFFSIPQTSPFNIGGAVLYKRTIAESRGAGFHVGGGFGLANINQGAAGASFAMNINAVGGFHFELPGISHIMVHLDGGPTFNLINTSPNTTTNFQVGALSPALGASVVYIF